MDIDHYFDEDVLKKELQLFDDFYWATHVQLIPDNGSYQVLSHSDDRWTAINDNYDFYLQSNICLHRQAKISEGRGKAKIHMCRAHCWSYDQSGKLKAAPHFDTLPDKSLQRRKLNNWNGLLYLGEDLNLDLSKYGVDDLIDFSKFQYHSTSTTDYDFNWKTFAEVYLENLHIYAMHPGLRRFVDPQDLEWKFGKRWSLQKIGVRPNPGKIESEAYQDMVEALKMEGLTPQFGAVWIYIYPNIMVEWYPKVIAISTIYPKTPERTTNCVDLFFEEGTTDEFREVFERVYNETALEDEEACLLLQKGRKALWLNGETESGPVHDKLEAGLTHFWEWLRSQETKIK